MMAKAKKLTEGEKTARINGKFLIWATIITVIGGGLIGIWKISSNGNKELVNQKISEQKIDTGIINNYNSGGDIKIENNTFNNQSSPSNVNSSTNKNLQQNRIKEKVADDTVKKASKYVINAPVDNRGGAIGDNNVVNNTYSIKQRHATSDVINDIMLKIPIKETSIVFWIPMGDKESLKYINEIANVLNRQGYRKIAVEYWLDVRGFDKLEIKFRNDTLATILVSPASNID